MPTLAFCDTFTNSLPAAFTHQMYGCKIRQAGNKLRLTNCSQIRIYKTWTESLDGVTFNLEFKNEEEAHSWFVSMVYGGAEAE